MSSQYFEEPDRWRNAKRGALLGLVLVLGSIGYMQMSSSGSTSRPTAEAADLTFPPAPLPAPTLPAPPTTLDVPGTSTTDAPTTTFASTTTTSSAPTTSDDEMDEIDASSEAAVDESSSSDAPPATMPDGSAIPVVAIFDVATITLAGAVPNQAAADRLTALALANSKTEASVIDLLTIDPSVPEGVGIRVVELTSSRFPAGSSEIVMAHAAELNRMVAVMNALPNVTVLVIGHADQIGSEQNNFELSEERAQAVVHYLVEQGIDASRLSARAVGESDLLSVDDDATSLALNRRTEFVVYGALVPD